MEQYVGLDVSQEQTSVCVVDGSGDGCPRRVMVLSAVGVSRRMMVSEALAS